MWVSLFGQAGIFYFIIIIIIIIIFFLGEISWYSDVLVVMWHEKVVCYMHTSIVMPNSCTLLEAIY